MKLRSVTSLFLQLPPSRRRQWVSMTLAKLVTKLIYAPRLHKCGLRSIVQRPLFWTPEFIELGSNVLIWPQCRIEGVSEYGGNTYVPRIKIGDNVTFQQFCHITAAGELRIGSGTTVLFGVLITDIDHQFDLPNINTYEQPIKVRKTQIGENCFIGAGARIQAGTTLGSQCIVGTNAVVRGNFPDHSVIVGIPGRIIKRLDTESGIWRAANSEGQFI